MLRVVQYQQPDGSWVQTVVDVPEAASQPRFVPTMQPQIAINQIQQVQEVQNINVVAQRPIPAAQPRGPFATAKAVLNGDLRYNPLTRQYEPVWLDRPERTGLAKAIFGR